MGVDMSDNPPTRDLFPSPALSLSLAGIFRDHHANAAAAAARRAGSTEVEEGDEGSGGGFGSSKGRTSREDTAVEISSENSGAVRSRSDDDEFNEELDDNDEDVDGVGVGGNKKKKRKKYHRHTADQIREMEALFKESPHPDEKQRQQLSKHLGLHPRQVKFWFQNRRTQIKAIQERHENSLLKTEIEQLKEENKSLRDTMHKAACPNCGFSTSDSSKHSGASSASININPTQQQHLKIENARLKAEVEKLKQMVGKPPPRGSTGTATHTTSPTSACSGAAGGAGGTGTDQENRSSLDFYAGIFGIEKSKVTDIANSALEELKKMAAAGPPLWVKSFETGREILNYDEYVKEFQVGSTSTSSTGGGGGRLKRAIEASRESGVVFVDLPKLVQTFMDENQWKEMFPCLISKAATVDVICNGEGPNKDGAVQLMFAELQMLTPMVPTREVYFVRYCRQLSAEKWAIVDVSIPKVEENMDASLVKCRKRASGCIIEDKSNGHCKVTWVEHLECQKTTLHSMYRSIVNSGLAFGARHWMTTLQLQCERLVFFMATNVPTKDSNGVATLAGRKSILKLAQRMTWSFCRAIGASSYNTWTKVTSKTGEDIRVASRKNLNDPAEPMGLILTVVSSVWLPVSPNVLFDFLRDHARRHEWDVVTADGGPVQSIANLAKGKDRGNAVAVQTTKSKEGSNMWFLQDSSTNAYESTVIYAPVDIPGMQSVMTGCDSSNLPILPCGFSILPDGVESRPMVISSREEERSSEGGSLLTIALQVVTPTTSSTAKLTTETMEPVKTLMSSTLQNIKTSLQCEDG